MNTDEILSIVKSKLVDEWQQLPIPADNDRILEMINTALKNAKAKIDRLNALSEKK